MIAHILLERLVAQHEAESPAGIHIDRLLQIQCVEGNHLLCRFSAFLFTRQEVKLAVDEPIVGNVESSAVVQKELGEFPWFCPVDIDGFRCGWEIVDGIPGDERRGIVNECRGPELVTSCPPAKVRWPEWAGNERENINTDDWWGRADGTRWQPRRDSGKRAYRR